MKQITVEIPDWVDERIIKMIIDFYFGKPNSKEEDIKKFLEILEKLPKAKEIDWEKLEELYYESKVLD